MRHHLRLPVFLLALFALSTPSIYPCTTFCLRDGKRMLVGKNYDWSIGSGLVVINKRGVEKSAMVPPGKTPARWKSAYGSLTFNQYGREFPSGGINDQGLVVELMWLDDTKYPSADTLPAIGTLQWIQYTLDNCSSVDQAIEYAERVAITSGVKLHYLVADRFGRSGTIEFLDGRLVAHTGETMPVETLTNHRYDSSLAYVQRISGFGGDAPVPAGYGSLERFARASSMARAFKSSGSSMLDYAFNILGSVAQPGSTQWSIVYDPRTMLVAFRTAGSPAIKRISLTTLDFSCRNPVTVLDLSSQIEGEIKDAMIPYTREINRASIAAAYAGTDFLKNTPMSEIEKVAAYPESLKCGR